MNDSDKERMNMEEMKCYHGLVELGEIKHYNCLELDDEG